MTMQIEAHPLSWPVGWPREHGRTGSRFNTTLAAARDGVFLELSRMGATDVVISSNAALKKDGTPAAKQSRIDDPGVAVYFTLNGKQSCIPCDRWSRVEDNLRAVQLTIAAMRGMDRWGAKSMVDAAFAGFALLPSGNEWWAVLGVHPNADAHEIRDAFQRLSKIHHPDVATDNGHDPDDDTYLRIVQAYNAAMDSLTVGV